MIVDGASGLLEQVDIDDVVVFGMFGMPTMFDGADGVGRRNDSLRKEESGGQLAVGAGRPHDDGERATVQAHLQRFFDRRRIFAGAAASAPDARRPSPDEWSQTWLRSISSRGCGSR